MDVPDSTSEATISEALDSRPADITSEARIQEALDYRRSQSSRNSSFSRPLSAEDEDELEGKAGDSGSARTSCIGDEIHDLDVLSIYQNSGAADPAGSKEAGMKAAPLDTHGASISRSLSSLRTVEQSTSGTLHKSLEVISILAHLTTFGILGVLVRYSLQVLFGPNVAKLTSNTSALFIDLPANMLGSFFMGWVGVVFKKDIAVFSEHLAVGLSTGLMGSITTYAAMMQTNLANMVTGSWVTGLFGLLIGAYFCSVFSITAR